MPSPPVPLSHTWERGNSSYGRAIPMRKSEAGAHIFCPPLNTSGRGCVEPHCTILACQRGNSGLRLATTYRDLPTYSVVWYLGGAGARDQGNHERSDLAGQGYLAWRYHVLHLWQLDAEVLLALQRLALLALIGQTRIRDPQPILTQAIRQIVAGTSGERQERLLTEFLLLGMFQTHLTVCADRSTAFQAVFRITAWKAVLHCQAGMAVFETCLMHR
jgi:hypothetical protein